MKGPVKSVVFRNIIPIYEINDEDWSTDGNNLPILDQAWHTVKDGTPVYNKTHDRIMHYIPGICWPVGKDRKIGLEILYFRHHARYMLIDPLFGGGGDTGWYTKPCIEWYSIDDFEEKYGSTIKEYSKTMQAEYEQQYMCTYAEQYCSLRNRHIFREIPTSIVSVFVIRGLKTDNYVRDEICSMDYEQTRKKQRSFLYWTLMTVFPLDQALFRVLMNWIKLIPVNVKVMMDWLTGTKTKYVKGSVNDLRYRNTPTKQYNNKSEHRVRSKDRSVTDETRESMIIDMDEEDIEVSSVSEEDEVEVLMPIASDRRAYYSRKWKRKRIQRMKERALMRERTMKKMRKRVKTGDGNVERRDKVKRKRKKKSESSGKGEKQDAKKRTFQSTYGESNAPEWDIQHEWYAVDFFELNSIGRQEMYKKRVYYFLKIFRSDCYGHPKKNGMYLHDGVIYVQIECIVPLVMKYIAEQYVTAVKKMRETVLIQYAEKSTALMYAAKKREEENNTDQKRFCEVLLSRFCETDWFFDEWCHNIKMCTVTEWLQEIDTTWMTKKQHGETFMNMIMNGNLDDCRAIRAMAEHKKVYNKSLRRVITHLDEVEWVDIFDNRPRDATVDYYTQNGIAKEIAELIVEFTPQMVHLEYSKVFNSGNTEDVALVNELFTLSDRMKDLKTALQCIREGSRNRRTRLNIMTSIPLCMQKTFYGHHPKMGYKTRTDAFNIIRNTAYEASVPMSVLVDEGVWYRLAAVNKREAHKEMRIYYNTAMDRPENWRGRCKSCQNRNGDDGSGQIICPLNGDIETCADMVGYSHEISSSTRGLMNPYIMWSNSNIL